MSFFAFLSLQKISQNWKSGLSVGLVALPLSIALSIASGAQPLSGVLTTIWAGLIASIFGGSKYNIIGVAGALSTILYTFSRYQGQNLIFALPFLAIFSGLFILIIWLFKLEKYLFYISSSVMYGFALGVAIIIAFGQINDAFGLEKVYPAKHFLGKILASWEQIETFQLSAFLVFLGTFLIIILLKKLKFKFPGAILVSALGILIGWLSKNYNLGFKLTTLMDKHGVLEAKLFDIPNFELFRQVFTQSDLFYFLLNTALIISLIATLETLITLKLADYTTGEKSDTHKEVLALGLANLVSGFLGGLPATGVFIRTGLNIKTGAKDRTSGVLASVFTAILALIFLKYFQYIPMAVIAGILFNTAIGLIEVDKFQKFWQEDRKSFIVSLLVALVTILEDASIGILAGVSLSLLFFVDKISVGEFEVCLNANKKLIKSLHGHELKNVDITENIDTVTYTIEGVMVYLDAQSHFDHLEFFANKPHIQNVVIRLRDLFYLDLDGLDFLEEAVNNLRNKGKRVLLTGVNENIYKILQKRKVFSDLKKENLFFKKTEEALKFLGFKQEDIHSS